VFTNALAIFLVDLKLIYLRVHSIRSICQFILDCSHHRVIGHCMSTPQSHRTWLHLRSGEQTSQHVLGSRYITVPYLHINTRLLNCYLINTIILAQPLCHVKVG
jgi:hypothetical protein